MKILFAEPDRDLLSGYQQLLSWHDHEVQEAFEGTQTLTKLAEGNTELLIIDEALPRLGLTAILRFALEEQVKTIVLLSASGRKLKDVSGAQADAYLSLPFEPEELYELIDSVSSASERESIEGQKNEGAESNE